MEDLPRLMVLIVCAAVFGMIVGSYVNVLLEFDVKTFTLFLMVVAMFLWFVDVIFRKR